jgi:tRNA(fMet)-specific endonuclease VapC
MCSIVVAELLYGAEKSNNRSRTRARVERFLGPFASLPFDDKCAAEYGIIRASLERQGRPIGGNDLMIAAIARRHDVVLVSHNQREFERVAGLRLEDWQAPA